MKEHKSHHKNEMAPKDAEATAQDQPAEAAPAQPSEVDQLKDRLLRLQADFDNYRKRIQREKNELSSRATEDMLRELLPIMDHFEIGLAMAAEHKTDATVQDGFRMVYDQLLLTLKKFDVTPFDAQSATFDPHQQEAVSHIPSNEYPPDHIIAQTRRGYKMGDRLLRPVQVVVSSGPGAPRDDEVHGAEEAGS
ncbi:MAG TPA: nucleotide exchange factor GrpE [Kiritimatiellia bacterium]